MPTPPYRPDLRNRVLNGDTTFGCWLTLASPLTAEIVGSAGFDWALIDLEHGSGTESEAAGQIVALAAARAASLVRVESGLRQRAGAVLDLGAAGVMFPRIENAATAGTAVAALRYPPRGTRGIAAGVRATGHGADFDTYREWAAEGVLGIVQVETLSILEELDAVAAIDGVDVLFVGPKDLSAALGVFGQFEHPDYLAALNAVANACHRQGKCAGILLNHPGELPAHRELGYRFLGCGSDGGFVTAGARRTAQALHAAIAGRDAS
ncbi:MAG: HpcH/HpaI aldolase family protein [Lysobacterales bacterium]